MALWLAGGDVQLLMLKLWTLWEVATTLGINKLCIVCDSFLVVQMGMGWIILSVVP